jgi:hypothetical protein
LNLLFVATQQVGFEFTEMYMGGDFIVNEILQVYWVLWVLGGIKLKLKYKSQSILPFTAYLKNSIAVCCVRDSLRSTLH